MPIILSKKEKELPYTASPYELLYALFANVGHKTFRSYRHMNRVMDFIARMAVAGYRKLQYYGNLSKNGYIHSVWVENTPYYTTHTRSKRPIFSIDQLNLKDAIVEDTLDIEQGENWCKESKYYHSYLK